MNLEMNDVEYKHELMDVRPSDLSVRRVLGMIMIKWEGK